MALTADILTSLLFPKRSRCGYIGWVGHHNLGDEALYQAAESVLKPRSLLPFFGKALKHPLMPLVLKQRALQSVCLGGGTLIFSGRSNLQAVTTALKYQIPVFSLGSGVIDPDWGNRDPDYARRLPEWINALEQFESRSVRGPISKAILDQHGLTQAQITGDLALLFSLTQNPGDVTEKIAGINIGTSNGNVWGENEEAILNSVVATTQILQKNGWKPVIFCVWPADMKICKSLAEKALLPPDSIQSHFDDAHEYLNAVSQCRVFLGMKLHSVVLACAAKVPSVMLEYKTKCADFMQSMDLMEFNARTDRLEPENLVNLIEQASDRYSRLRNQIGNMGIMYAERIRNSLPAFLKQSGK